jgi:hypothetical protein
MRASGRFRHWRWVVVSALCASGLLLAQRTYRGVPFPPELDLVEPPSGSNEPAEFYFARLAYSDPYGMRIEGDRPWMIDSPAAERHFLQGLRRLSNIHSRSKEVYIRAVGEELFDYPWIYVVEPGHWDLSDEEADGLREYLLRGGFIIFDDFHGTYEWAMFMRGIRKIFPSRPIVDLDPADEVFHVLYDLAPDEQIPGIQMLYTRRTFEQDGVNPHWRGMYDDDGRLMMLINHNMDLGDAWEHADWPHYPEHYTAKFVVFQSPFLHVAHTFRSDPVDDQLGVANRAQEPPQKGIRVPDLLFQGLIGEDLSRSSDAHLVVVLVQIAKLNLGVRFQLSGLVVAAQRGDVHREAVGSDGRNRAQAGLIPVDGGQHRELGLLDHLRRQFAQAARLDEFRFRFHDRQCSRDVARGDRQ